MLKYSENFYGYTINIYSQTPDKDWEDFYNLSEEDQMLWDQFEPTESKGEYRYEILYNNVLLESDDISMGDDAAALTNARWEIFIKYKELITDEKKLWKIYRSIYKLLEVNENGL
tara:strand:+ start:263 stop:607 length:345 start_codon:yes stop_codon:yes gene_type:complete